MFDLITGSIERPLREPAPGSKLISLAVHAVFVTLAAGIPLLHVANELPEVVPAIMAFVGAPVVAPPPPPPPLPKGAPRPGARPELESSAALAAPMEAPSGVEPEPMTPWDEEVGGVEGGVEGGVPGGIVGGIVGGIIGGLVPPAPPPPPLVAARPVPVRIGGQITAPALVHRVEPQYPDIAIAAQLTGLVILEAVVDTDGRVESVKVLRSRHPFLDRAAVDALRQWQYSPLVLNGIPTPFVLTVTFNFSVGPRLSR